MESRPGRISAICNGSARFPLRAGQPGRGLGGARKKAGSGALERLPVIFSHPRRGRCPQFSQGSTPDEFAAVRNSAERFWRRAELQMPRPKKGIYVRLDADVIEWLKSKGKGYQTRMNAMLRVLMESDRVRR